MIRTCFSKNIFHHGKKRPQLSENQHNKTEGNYPLLRHRTLPNKRFLKKSLDKRLKKCYTDVYCKGIDGKEYSVNEVTESGAIGCKHRTHVLKKSSPSRFGEQHSQRML